eukprot:969150_1
MKAAQKSSDITIRTPEIQCLAGAWPKLDVRSKCYKDDNRFSKFFAKGGFGESTNDQIAADVRTKSRDILQKGPNVSDEILDEIIQVSVTDKKNANDGKSLRTIVVTSRCTFYQDICDANSIDFGTSEFQNLD